MLSIKHFSILLILILLASCAKEMDTRAKISKSIPKNKFASEINKFGAWLFSKQGNSCYIYSFPISSSGFYTDRNIHYLLINDKKEIAVVGGAKFKPSTQVRIDAHSHSFFLDVDGDHAWANNETEIITNLLENKEAILFIYSEFETTGSEKQAAVDKYSLQGFLEAWEYMTLNCEVEPLINNQSSKENGDLELEDDSSNIVYSDRSSHNEIGEGNSDLEEPKEDIQTKGF